MKYYVKLDENNIVISTINTTKEPKGDGWIEVDYADDKLGKHWNGKTFEDVEREEQEVPETTEVTNADLLEVLLAIGEKVGA